MDASAQVAASIASMNDVLRLATAKNLDVAKKMLAVTVEAEVGAASEAGKGAVIDTYA